MPIVILTNPDTTAFEAGFETIAKSKVAHPGRSSKVLGPVANNYIGKTTFGGCEVAWIGDHGDKHVVITTGVAVHDLNFIPRHPSKNPPRPGAVLVSEYNAGPFAYFTDRDEAQRVANSLNYHDGVNPEAQDRPYNVLNFSESEHGYVFDRQLINDQAIVLSRGDGRDDLLGYVIAEHPDAIRLLVA